MSILNSIFQKIMMTQTAGTTPSLDNLLAKFDKELENFQSLV